MQRASVNATEPPHEVPAGAALRTSPPLVAPARTIPISAPLPPRPTLLPLSFVLALVAAVAVGSTALTLAVAHFAFNGHPAGAPPAAPVETKVVAEAPRPEPVKEAPPAPDTLAILPFEIQFEPTPAFQHEVEKLNAALPQLLADAGKLRVKPVTET